MGLKEIGILSTSSHFYSDIILSFLNGYEGACDIKKVYLLLPIIFDEDSRERLINANSRSRLETIISKQNVYDITLSALTRVNMLNIKYELYKDKTSRALIILTSENKAEYKEYKFTSKAKIRYQEFDDDKKRLLKSAYYLGKVFKKVNIDHITNYLGVEF